MGKSIWDYVDDAKEAYDKYKDLANAGASAVKGYLDYKNQKKANEAAERAYNDYTAEKDSAGLEAQAAVDINLTPMTITGLPKTKADVTDFTALAANGGIIGLKNGGDPNAGITALRKTAPGVVDRMGFEDGTGEKGVQSSFNPLNRILEKIKDMKYKSELGRTDDGDLAERTSEYVDNNPFKKNITAIREPGESENRAMLNAMINDGLDTEETMDEASKDKIILGLVQEMFRNGDMEKDEYEMYMESYINEMQKGGIAGLRNGGRPGYMFGEGPVMDNTDGTVSIEEAVSETEKPMKMAYEPGVPTTGDLYDLNNPAYEGINKKVVIEFIEEGIPLGYSSPEEYFEDFYGIIGMKKGGRVKRAGGGVMDLGGMEKDYRFDGGFVPIGEYEKKDDVPARLSKNEFVFTADAVRAAGGGSINKGAQKMYDTMKNLEAKPTAKRMTA